MEDRTPETAAEEMSAGELEDAKRYGRDELVCTLLDMALDVLYLSVMAFWLALPLDRWLHSFSWLASSSARLAVFFLITVGIHYAVSFPLSFYSGFVLEHRYGLSRQSAGRWLGRYLKQNALVTVFGLAMTQGLFWIIWTTGAAWWLVASMATFAVTVLIGQLAPVLILPLFYQVERLDDQDLMGAFRRLAEGTGLAIEGVYRMTLSSETVKANAMLMGMGRTRRVILADTLLDDFTPEEIQVVLAHEIGHHVYRHLWKLVLLGLVTSVLSFLVADRLFVAWVAGGSVLDYSAMPIHALPLLMLVITASSLVFGPLRNVIMRRFERQCDSYALRQTNDPASFRSSFQKLARLNKANPDPHWLEVALFHDHPPIADRLALADPAGSGSRR